MTTALVRQPSSSLVECELAYIARDRIDLQVAFRQHDQYCTSLRNLGIEVEILPPLDTFPDSVFIEDNAIILDELAVLASMGTVSRQGEPRALYALLFHKFRVVEISPPATIEGGDVLCVGKTVFVGLSTRTNEAGVELLQALLRPFGYHVISIAVTRCLHLKTACTPLDDKTLLVNPAWVDLEVLKAYRLISVPSKEPYAANVMRLPTGLLASASYPKTLERIRAEGYPVMDVDISEFHKAEAGLTCLSLIIP